MISGERGGQRIEPSLSIHRSGTVIGPVSSTWYVKRHKWNVIKNCDNYWVYRTIYINISHQFLKNIFVYCQKILWSSSTTVIRQVENVTVIPLIWNRAYELPHNMLNIFKLLSKIHHPEISSFSPTLSRELGDIYNITVPICLKFYMHTRVHYFYH